MNLGSGPGERGLNYLATFGVRLAFLAALACLGMGGGAALGQTSFPTITTVPTPTTIQPQSLPGSYLTFNTGNISSFYPITNNIGIYINDWYVPLEGAGISTT